MVCLLTESLREPVGPHLSSLLMDGKLEFTKFSETVFRQVQKSRLRSGVLDFGDLEKTKTGDTLVFQLQSIMADEQVSLKKVKRRVETGQAGS